MGRAVTALRMVSVHPLSADCFAIACRAMIDRKGERLNATGSREAANEMACMAHVRRKFVDIFTAQGSAIAEEAIKRIAKLYAVEKEARGKSPQKRAAHRQADAKPIFDDLEKWLHAQLPKISGKSPLAKAIRYALGVCRRHVHI